MTRYRACLFAVAAVTAWCIFAYTYLGITDGSSGLGAMGWLSAIFFLPGGLLLQMLKGSHSNADLPLMAGISWLGWSILATATAHVLAHMRAGKRQ